ncbi:hypothetical protein Droror1_Dr00008766 [Drosera rotundifolia]
MLGPIIVWPSWRLNALGARPNQELGVWRWHGEGGSSTCPKLDVPLILGQSLTSENWRPTKGKHGGAREARWRKRARRVGGSPTKGNSKGPLPDDGGVIRVVQAVSVGEKEIQSVSFPVGKRGKLNKVVLAYSGGLDTSVIVPWLR